MTTVRRAANCSSTVAQRFLCVRRSSAREPPRDQLLVRHLFRSGGTIKRYEETTIRLFSRMPLEAGTGTRTVLLTVDPLRGQEGERGRRDGAAGNLGQGGGSGHAHFNKIGAGTRTTEATTQCARYCRNIFALVFPRRVIFSLVTCGFGDPSLSACCGWAREALWRARPLRDASLEIRDLLAHLTHLVDACFDR